MRHRNYQLYLSGQSISLIGSWMTRLALSWLTYRLTHSALMLGIVGFAGQILTFLLAPVAGVWIDRLDRRKLLVCTQSLAAAQSLALAALTLAHIITIPEILLLAALQGLIDAFDMPARQAFLVKMIGNKEDLGNAIALNSSAVNLARLIGPPIAAVIIARSNEGVCFLVDGLSYLAVIGSLLLIRVARDQPEKLGRPSVAVQLRDGWRYVSTYVPVRNILLLFSLSSLMGSPYIVLLPIFATQILHGGPHTLAFLTTASGIGALVSAVSLAVRKNVLGLLRMIQIASVVFGSGLILFAWSHWLPLSLFGMLLVGFGMVQGLAASNTIVQTLAPEEKRGRVMSFYTMAFIGMMPFGSLLAGAVAHWIGAPHTLMLSGSTILLGALLFFLQRKPAEKAMRTRYQELGILPGEPRVSV